MLCPQVEKWAMCNGLAIVEQEQRGSLTHVD